MGSKSERARATVVQVCLGLDAPGTPLRRATGKNEVNVCLAEVAGELGQSQVAQLGKAATRRSWGTCHKTRVNIRHLHQFVLQQLIDESAIPDDFNPMLSF
jgi:hypothetical protein